MHKHDNSGIHISQMQLSSNSSSLSSSLVDNDHLESISLSNQFTNAALHNSDESISSSTSTLRSTHPSLKTNSTTTTTTSSISSSKQSKRKQDQLRFQQIFNGTNSKSKAYKRCTCKKNQKQFDCHECTQPFPIQVRRSRDGESGILYNLEHNFYMQSQAIEAQSATSKTSNKSRIDPNLISSVEEESDEGSGSSNSSSSNCSLTTQNHQPAIILKPTPFKTVSPTLLSLLAMSNPNSRFVPPPNISLSTYSKNS